MKQELETMEFKDGPLADLISELEIEAVKWCEGNCPEMKGFFARLLNPLGNLPCFNNPVYHLELIENCKKIPKLYKLYWKAKAKNIRFISPLIVYKEEDDQPRKS